MELSKEIIDFMRDGISSGKKPSQLIRDVFGKYGEIPPVYLADYFMEAFHLRHLEVMPYLNQWWVDPATSDMTDDELDAEIETAILENLTSWKKQ